jgi:hypothetical protein
MQTFSVRDTTRDVMLPDARALRHVGEAFDRSVAIVLGVNDYQRGVPRLKTAVADADALAAVLEVQHGFTTLVRRDTEVTCASVRALFDRDLAARIGGELTERDRLLVYFAGHGVSMSSDRGPEGWLLLADADAADPRSFFAMSELRASISALPCRHVMIILDCCFAGSFRWSSPPCDRSVGARVYRESLERFVRHRAWQVLVSAGHDQAALDAVASGRVRSPSAESIGALATLRIETEAHSPFAAALLRGLQGAADYTGDGLIVATELELYVRDAVERATRIQQTPQLHKLDEHDRGEFVFQVPDAMLALEPAPALSLTACPYQGLRPYGAAERDRFFGRGLAIAALVDRVKTRPLTVVLGRSGAGKSSLMAAGLVPVLRDTGHWTVVEARPGPATEDSLRDAIAVPEGTGLAPGSTLLDRITAWLSAHPSGQLCLAIDQAEGLMMVAGAEACARTLADLAQALEAHGSRLRVVLALRSEFEPVFRASALGPLWAAGVFPVPAMAHHELREIIEQPARSAELTFDPPALVDTLIDEVLQAPGGLPLLSFALRELYVRCAERNRDRLLTESDYADMGRLSGALAQRASQLLNELVAQDRAYEATARRVFLRMVISHDDEWVRRRVHRDELEYADRADDQRVTTLLQTFRDARLIVHDKGEWEPAHDWLVRGWPVLATWRVRFGAKAFALQFDLGEAANRWHRHKRAAQLWTDDPRLPDARNALRAPDCWLNARERAFLAASVHRRRLRVGAVVAALGVIALGALGIWDLYYRPHIDYYRSYVLRWGEPVGIDPLSERNAQGRASSVRLVRAGRLGHVQRLEMVGGGEALALRAPGAVTNAPELDIGARTEGERVVCQWDYAYVADANTVGYETARDCQGNVIHRLQYRGGSRGRAKAAYVDLEDNDAPVVHGNAELVAFVRSPQGFDIEKHYMQRYHGKPGQNQDRISIELRDYDERGHAIGVAFRDEAGRPTRNKDGVAGWRSTYDERGDETEKTYVDEAGKPTRNKDGVATMRATFDARGNQIEIAFLDEAGKPTRNKDGVASMRSTYDARGNQIRLALFDAANRPTWNKDGIAGWRAAFDARGNQTESAFFDVTNRPTWNKDGIAAWRATFDAHGNRTGIAFFDAMNRPARSKDGVAGWRATFDGRGNLTASTYLDGAGNPARNKDGIAGWRSTFDAHGYEIERTYLDEAGQPTWGKDGYASQRFTVDDHGKQTAIAYFDRAGNPTRDKGGVAGTRAKYNDRGDQVEIEFVDEAGHPLWHADGYASGRRVFDDRGQSVEMAWFDEADHPTTLNQMGCARTRVTYDARDNLIELRYFDEAGHPIRNVNGVAGLRNTFDAWGNQIEHLGFDEAGKVTRAKNGPAYLRQTFDERGHAIETRFLDEAGALIATVGSVAMARMTFDTHGNEIEHALFDKAGKPTRNPNGVALVRRQFDERGNEIELAYLDEAGKPTLHKEGGAGVRSAFDERGNQIEAAWFDEAGHPVRTPDGYASWRSRFDEHGHEAEVAFFDEGGRPVRRKDGYASWKSTFDEHGHEILAAYFDEAGQPTRHKDGNASRTSTFDRSGNLIAVAYFDEAGRPVRITDGYASRRSTFDAHRNETARAFFDEAGRPVRHKDGYASLKATFDERRNEITRAFFNEAGKPVRHKDGYASWRSTFDDRGNEIARAYFDEAGRPARHKDGYASWRSTFDDRGNETARSYFDQTHRPVPAPKARK